MKVRDSYSVGEVITKVREEGENVLIQTYQDVQPHLDFCARKRRDDSESRGHFGARREFRQTMSIPNNLILKVCLDLGIEPGQMFHPEYERRWRKELKKSEYRYFRTTNDKNIK